MLITRHASPKNWMEEIQIMKNVRVSNFATCYFQKILDARNRTLNIRIASLTINTAKWNNRVENVYIKKEFVYLFQILQPVTLRKSQMQETEH